MLREVELSVCLVYYADEDDYSHEALAERAEDEMLEMLRRDEFSASVRSRRVVEWDDGMRDGEEVWEHPEM